MADVKADGPLAGTVVVDFSSMVSGPWATRLLADCGATVVKVEPPGGDYMRALAPRPGSVGRPYAHLNAGKRSIVLDLSGASGQAVARRLIEAADVVVENFRPGVMRRRGLDYQSVRAGSPTLVYCSLSGYGQEGPLAEKAAYAPIVEADSGYNHVEMAAQVEGQHHPRRSPLMMADVIAGLSAFAAIQSALIARARTGEGSFVDVTLIEAIMSVVGVHYQQAQADPPVKPMTHRPVRTSDGWLMLAPVSVNTFHALYRAMGRPELVDDPGYGSVEGTRHNRDDIFALAEAWAATLPTDRCLGLLTDAGVPCARFREPGEVVEDQALIDLGAFTEMRDEGGTFKVLNPPFRLSSLPCAARPFVEDKGASTLAVLADVLGLSQSEVSDLSSAGVLGEEMRKMSSKGCEGVEVHHRRSRQHAIQGES